MPVLSTFVFNLLLAMTSFMRAEGSRAMTTLCFAICSLNENRWETVLSCPDVMFYIKPLSEFKPNLEIFSERRDVGKII